GGQPVAVRVAVGSVHIVEDHFHGAGLEVIFDYVDGPNSDPDGDGLPTQEENDLRSRYECLSPTDLDSDDDGLSDGEEVNRYGTSPCSPDTDGDGFRDFLETRETCFQPLVADTNAAPGSDPDGDGLTNAQEGALGTRACLADSDGDGFRDSQDNCPRIASPQPLPDFDGDGMGDPCDPDADNDGCEKQYDDNDLSPGPVCRLATRDRFNPRRFLAAEEDLRLVFLDAYLENLGRPQPRGCGQVDCPPPMAQWTDPRFETVGLVRGPDFGLSAGDGFAWAAAVLPDLDGRGKGDLAVSAPWADGPAGIDAGVVLLVSGEDNKELGRLRGTVAGGAFGSSLALLKDGRLAVGAPGATGKAGQVQVYRLSTQKLERTFTANRADDRFGAAIADLGDTDGDGLSELGVGAPGWGGFGAVYTAGSGGTLSALAIGKGTGDRLGERLAKVSDTDADGRPELLVGSPGATRSGRSGAGEVTLFGLDGTRYWSQAGRQSGEAFGSALAVNESSKGAELLVGAPGASCEAGSRCGRGYLLRPDGSAIGFMNGTQAGAEAGRYVAFGPDLDGDGLRSLVLVEPVPTSAAGMGRSQFFER
ncbi:MAG TPA: thrombospondin type 3 repeat-containing protein, partial [Thermoanaerobaculia bacterium]|nr:thrombospondin type 3 repeat-containing protein [Thermoanaerobaculia bacterium]